MKVREVIKAIEARGGVMLRQRGSHRFYRVEVDGIVAHTTVAGKSSDQVTKGLLAKMESDLSIALGKGWLK